MEEHSRVARKETVGEVRYEKAGLKTYGKELETKQWQNRTEKRIEMRRRVIME